MNIIVEPGEINGNLKIPASKSMMQRVCACALLHHGVTRIYNPGNSDDDKAALKIVEQFGATVYELKDYTEIHSTGILKYPGEVFCGESGLSARLFTPIAALLSEPVLINGRGTLLHRSMQPFEEIFSKLEVAVPGFSGHLPFTVLGPIKARSFRMNGSLSSQFLSGILIALAFTAKEKITIEVGELKSKPYVDMTLDVLKRFGRTISHSNYQSFHIDPKDFLKQEVIELKIESDWSSAAFFMIAGVLNGNISLKDLQQESYQADRLVVEVLKEAGADSSMADGNIPVKTNSGLSPFRMDLTDAPDLFPIFSVLAANIKGTSNIKGLHRLKHKESDRENTIAAMLKAFGVSFEIVDDSLIIDGGKTLQSTTIDSFNDHRIAMAAAIGALNAAGPVTILNAGCVSKSYPAFFEDLASLGIHTKTVSA